MTTQYRQNVPGNFGDAGTGLAPNGASVPTPPPLGNSPPAFGSAAIPPNPDLATILWALLARVAPAMATYAALLAFGAGTTNSSNPNDRQDGMIVLVEADNSLWRWNASATSGLQPNDTPSTGRWQEVGGGSGASGPAANPNAIMAISEPQNGQLVVDQSTGYLWRWSPSSTATDSTQNLALSPAAWATGTVYAVGSVVTANGNVWQATSTSGSGTSAGSGTGPTGSAIGATFTDNPGGNQIVWTLVRIGTTGAWVRVADVVDLKLAVDHTTADGAVLFTVPSGFKLRISRAYWEVTVGWTGGASSAIAVDSSNAHYNTAGDILGGSTGDVAATLVTTGGPYVGGTLGTKFGSNGVVGLVATDTVKFNRVTSNFTVGSGFVHLSVELIG